jgi:hypothetical protein
MGASSEYGLPDSYILTYLEYRGIAFKTVPRPFVPQDDDLLLISIEPIHPDPELAKRRNC